MTRNGVKKKRLTPPLEMPLKFDETQAEDAVEESSEDQPDEPERAAAQPSEQNPTQNKLRKSKPVVDLDKVSQPVIKPKKSVMTALDSILMIDKPKKEDIVHLSLRLTVAQHAQFAKKLKEKRMSQNEFFKQVIRAYCGE